MKEKSKPWYKSPVFYFKAGLYAVAFPFVFTYMMVKELAIPAKKRAVYVAGLWGFVLMLLIFNAGKQPSPRVVTQSAPTNEVVTESKPSEANQAVNENYDYEILSQKSNGNVENFSILVKPGELNGEAIATEIKAQCVKSCNIDVYDDKKAFELQQEYDTMMGDISTPKSKIDAWKKNNYVFVADHYIGGVNFELGTYDDYPFRDWYYDELKGL